MQYTIYQYILYLKFMALVYPQSTTQDVNQTMAVALDIDYQQQREKSVEEATNSGCYEQPLCFYDESSSFNTTVSVMMHLKFVEVIFLSNISFRTCKLFNNWYYCFFLCRLQTIFLQTQ